MIFEAGIYRATIIVPTAHVSAHSTVNEDSVIMHYAMVNADTHITQGCIMNTMSNTSKDVEAGDYCHIFTKVFFVV